MTGLLKLTWVEIKIFLREPLGVIGSVVVPLFVFFAVSGASAPAADDPELARHRQAALHVRDRDPDGAGRQTVLSADYQGRGVELCGGAHGDHVLHSRDRI